MELFGLDIASMINDGLEGNLRPLTLHKVTHTLDSYGVPVASDADHQGEGVRLTWDARLAVARGYPLDAAKILVLQNGIVAPAIGDGLTIEGERWAIIDVTQDPAQATWSIAATSRSP